MSDQLRTTVRDALRIVIDPELGYNIVDLGFVYDVTVDDGGVAHIVMTATTPRCPATAFLKEGAMHSVMQVPGIAAADVVMTFDPPWTPAKMTPALQAALGFG